MRFWKRALFSLPPPAPSSMCDWRLAAKWCVPWLLVRAAPRFWRKQGYGHETELADDRDYVLVPGADRAAAGSGHWLEKEGGAGNCRQGDSARRGFEGLYRAGAGAAGGRGADSGLDLES